MDKNLKRTFIVQVFDNQNATWQGTIKWADEDKTECFRSLLELVRLIDSAVASEQN